MNILPFKHIVLSTFTVDSNISSLVQDNKFNKGIIYPITKLINYSIN